MADKKITQLPSLSFISGSNTGYYAGEVVLPIVHNSTTVKMEAQKFALYATQWSATTASNTFIGNQTVNGNVTVTGKITAEEFFTEITSASIIFQSGSTLFGNSSDDIHTFTGTINVNGKVVGNAPLDFTSQSLNIATGSYNRLYNMTSSVHSTTASLNTQTGSQQLINVQNSTVTSSLNLATASLNFTTGALNIASGSYNRFYQVTASVHSTTASLNQATSSLNFASGALNIATGSYNRFYDMTSSVHFTTQSLNVQTGSQDTINFNISKVTASIDAHILGISIYTASLISQTNTISTFTSSVNFATSSLNTQTGSQDLVNRRISSVTGSMNTQSSSQDLVNYQNSIVTSSFRNEIGGIEAYTASLKGATIVSSSTQIFTGYDYEIHVSQVDGNDTTGNGDLLTPVASITKALQIVSSSYLSTDRRTIIIHPGTYTESPTITLANTYIFALGLLGANTAIAGTLTINAACRVSGIKMTNLVVNTTGAVYINNTTVDTQMTVTNTGYLETTGCSFQCPSGVTVSGAAPAVVFNSTTLWGLVVSNASAVVIVRNSPQVYVATVTAGNLALSNTLLFSATNTGNAITTSAGSVVTLSNLNILTPSGLAVARVSLSGFYSIIDVVYDKPNSTLIALSGTGGSLNSIDYFQYINADKFITQGGTGYQFLKGDGSLDSTMPASLQQTTASLNTYTGSNDSVVARILQTTASLNLTTGSLIGITNGLMAFTAALDNTYATDAQLYQLYQATRSLELHSGSIVGVTNGLMALTASMKGQTIFSGSAQLPEIGGLEAYTASLKGAAIVSSSQQITNYFTFAKTGSANTFYGNQSISGSLTVNSTGASGISINSSNDNPTLNFTQLAQANSSARNWRFVSNYEGWGTMDLQVSNDHTTLPSTLTRVSITGGGDVNLKTGNLIFANGKGIDFSATANSGSTVTSEILDDYEVGTWTPTDGSGAGLTFTSVFGRYVKIGKQVTVHFRVNYPSTVDATAAIIGGLPYVVDAGNNYMGGVVHWTDASMVLTLMAIDTTSTLSVRRNADNADPTNANLSTKILRGTVTYQTF